MCCSDLCAATTTCAFSPESDDMAEAFVNTFKRDNVNGGGIRDVDTVTTASA
jgi:hypothetical protein